MLAHISPAPAHYSETLHTTQLASRIHRMRRKKTKSSGSSGGGSATGSTGSSDEAKKLVRLGCPSSSDFTASSSEQSCDTVIYVGDRGDGEGTDAEHPPVYLPNMNCDDDNRGVMAKALRGSSADLMMTKQNNKEERAKQQERRRSSISAQSGGHSRMKGCGSVGATPTRMSALMAAKEHHHHPAHQEVMQLHGGYSRQHGSLPRNPKGKMPLYGKVAGYRQMASPIHRARGQQQQQQREEDDWTHQLDQFYGDGGALYGYMDEHKKGMIRQWVKCQSEQIKRMSANGGGSSNGSVGSGKGMKKKMPVSPSNSGSSGSGLSTVGGKSRHTDPDAPEPFAWVTEGLGADSGNCKVLTQFKTAESSEESLSSSDPNESSRRTISADVHFGSGNELWAASAAGDAADSIPPSPVVSSSSFEGREDDEEINGDRRRDLIGGTIRDAITANRGELDAKRMENGVKGKRNEICCFLLFSSTMQ
jgi:hypothetical protein